MSVDYASGLSHYDDLGVCGVNEVFDTPEILESKIQNLAELIRQSKRCIVHVGAGISTTAGIPDFRGPKGVWTKQLQQRQEQSTSTEVVTELEKASSSISFDTAVPTYTHRALCTMLKENVIHHIVSQNVDGLFLKCNVPRKHISELHGNFFLDECTVCKSRFIRSTASSTMGLKKSNVKCARQPCRGSLRDTILDWESPIPFNELRTAEREALASDLHICMGTTMQLQPANRLPVYSKGSKKSQKQLVIINLQPTKLDSRADLIINYYVDDVMRGVINKLDLETKVAKYDPYQDPTKTSVGESWSKVSQILSTENDDVVVPVKREKLEI